MHAKRANPVSKSGKDVTEADKVSKYSQIQNDTNRVIAYALSEKNHSIPELRIETM